MKIGRKLYFDKATGAPILLTDEQNSRFAQATTREQDFARFRELSSRNPETVDVLQLDYGQHRGDFEKATSFRVNVETRVIEFELPEAFKSHEATIRELESAKMELEAANEALKAANEALKAEVSSLKEKNTKLEEDITNAQVAIAEIFETAGV